MSPWVLLAVIGAWISSLWFAIGVGQDMEVAAHARENTAAASATAAATSAAAAAISRIEVQRVEITQPILREVRTKTVYMECRHTPDGLRGVNAALTGRAEPAGAGQLPAASAPDR